MTAGPPGRPAGRPTTAPGRRALQVAACALLAAAAAPAAAAPAPAAPAPAAPAAAADAPAPAADAPAPVADAGGDLAAADPAALLDALADDDPAAVARAVALAEALPAAAPGAADARFAAGRAAEERLADPARALALYARILADAPDDRVAAAAAGRAARLRDTLGPDGEHAGRAAALARLIAEADHRPADEVLRDARALAAAPWPGAPDAALWLGEWQRRRGEPRDALATLEALLARAPATPQAAVARREAAAAALEAGAWDRARALAAALPGDDPADALTRETLLAAAREGRALDRWRAAAWLAVLGAGGGLLAALVAAGRRHGRRALRAPIEVLYLGPVVGLLTAVALTANPLVLPAVATIGGGGLVLAGLSGAALDAHRGAGRDVRARSVVHALACVLGVLGLALLALTHAGLLELLLETVRAGPER